MNPPDQIGPLMTAHYRGLGFMEQYDYRKAEEAFREVHDLAPRWIPGSINLAIALLYQWGSVSEGYAKEERALSLLDDVIARDPKNLHAHYCRGLIFVEKAHAEFQLVTENDPRDAYAWYMLGSTADGGGPDQGNPERIAAFKKALDCNPYLFVAVYKLATAYRKAGDPEAFRTQLELFRRLNGGQDRAGPGDDTSNSYYGGIGRYAQVINPLADLKPPPTPIRAPRFEPPVPIVVQLTDGEKWVSNADFGGRLAVVGRARSRFGAPVAVFDADGDGLLDVYLAAAIAGPQGVRDALLLNRGSGRFEDVTRSRGLPLNRPSVGVAAGDFDADGLTDLFLTGIGDNRLYRNQGPSG
ncbi:MAG TPA: FG-GAP-like repeat-containing protein, partial [Planctomycetaceae bacterium]|nr:FG-GAP-like repeat-containing protein [Planctomycetaceae bacterium]